jgi:hypothetical protein
VSDDDYEARGIFPDTWTCVSVGTKVDAKNLLFDLALSGVPALASRDADGKRWHIAVQGGMKGSPMTYVVAIRSAPYRIAECVGAADGGQHPRTPNPIENDQPMAVAKEVTMTDMERTFNVNVRVTILDEFPDNPEMEYAAVARAVADAAAILSQRVEGFDDGGTVTVQEEVSRPPIPTMSAE